MPVGGETPPRSVTELLVEWRAGSKSALEQLMDRVYPELRRLARLQVRNERDRNRLQPTALVHEAYLRLLDVERIDWQDRQHFFAMASTMMRRILVEQARARQRHKRRGVAVTLQDDAAVTPGVDVEVMALDQALDDLEAEGYDFECQVVQLRFFGGMTNEEVAEHLKVGRTSVVKAWTFARAWLFRELGEEPE